MSPLARVWRRPGAEPVQQIRAGDVVWFAPGEKHWHGAGPDTALTHIAMQEALDGVSVDWLEKVSDEQYPRGMKRRGEEGPAASPISSAKP